MKNTFSSEQIQVVMEKSGITRKSALKKLSKMSAKELAALIPAAASAVDVKSRQANDDSTVPAVVTTPAPAKAKKAAPAPKPVVPQTAAGAARGEGIRLFKLSNVATLAKDENTTAKALFIHVYGPKGHTMTCEQRAKVVGLASAEEAAKQFARMRGAKPQEFVKAEPKPEKK